MKFLRRIAAVLLSAVLLAGLVPVYASGSTKLIALTFDDGPSYAQTPKLLDGLKERGVHVTFFMTGQNAKNNPSLVKRAWKDGHQICSHTYDHAMLTSLSDSEIKAQLSKTDKILDKAIGYDLNYSLRPPYGAYSDRVLNAVGRPCYYWSVDTRDWESRNATAAYNQFIRAAKNGSIVLMHDLYPTTVTAALNAVDTLLKEGYEFVTLNELMVRRGSAPQAGKIYFSAYPGDYGTDPTLSAPVISYEDSAKGKRVVITGDSRAKIYYTVDGSAPRPDNCKLYKGSFAVADGTKVRAICVYDWNGFKSKSVSRVIDYVTLGTPTISLDNGLIKIGGLPEGTVYYYTTDGSVPDKTSNKYTGGITPKAGTVYTARGYTPGYNNGGWTWLSYSSSGRVYTDMRPDCWYYAAADRAVSEGIVGISGTEFSANARVTRAQMVSMLYHLGGSPVLHVSGAPFADIDATSTYYNAVVWAYQCGIIIGIGDGRFDPTAPVSREQVCAMLNRGIIPEVSVSDDIIDEALRDFTDADDIEPSMRYDVGIVCAMGIMHGYGDGTLCPKGSITRAEAAAVAVRAEDSMSLA